MIDTDEKLAVFLPQLKAAPWIALDTEADSLHAYPEKLCLIQVSIPGVDELLDPLAPSFNLAPAFEIFRRHELIFHGADYDLRLLHRHCHFVPTAIFDTMLASRLLGCREFGLVNLVAKYLGVKLEKGPQKANWARRPLTPRMEEYARHDTHYLKPLVELLTAELQAKNRLTWHQQACAQLIASSTEARPADPDTVWRVKGSHQLPPAGLAVLREIWRWRETEAVAANRPPFFIVSPDLMVDFAAAAAAQQEIEPLFPRYLTPRRRKGILQAVHAGLSDPNPPHPLKRRGRRLTETEKRRLEDLDQRRNQRAESLGLDPTIVASRATLIALASDAEDLERDLLPWQRELLES